MAIIAISSFAGLEPFSGQRAVNVSSIRCGANLTAGHAVRLDTATGTILPASTASAQNSQILTDAPGGDTVTVAVSDFLGFVARNYISGECPAVWGNGAKFMYSDANLTPGQYLWIADVANAGELSDAPLLVGDQPVAIALTSSMILCIR